MVIGIPGLSLAAIAALAAITLLLVAAGNGAVLGARDAESRSVVTASGVSDDDVAVYRRAGAAANVPWQLLAALAQAQQAIEPGAEYPEAGVSDTDGLGPYRIAPGTTGISVAGTRDLAESAGFIAGRLAQELDRQGVTGGADLLTARVVLDQQVGFRIDGTASVISDPAEDRKASVVAALVLLPVRLPTKSFMSGVYDTALGWALGRGDATCDPLPGTPSPAGTDMPYPLPASHGVTGAEETIDAEGRVPSGKGNGVVTWSQHAALGKPYRDFYITMRWNYAAWNWDGTSTAIDQAQFAWFAQQPRLVLVTNRRTSAAIIAAALEAGPAPRVGITSSGAGGSGADQGWPGPTRGTPDEYTGIVSGFPPTALTALGDATGPARTGYPGQTGDDLIYEWAPDQTAIPGPTTATGAGPPGSTTTGGGCHQNVGFTAGGAQVQSAGVSVTIPDGPTVDPAAAGQTVTAPIEDVARGLTAGLATVGMPYVWGGGTGGGGPDTGCIRGGGQKNSCAITVGLDCSGLTGWTLTSAGFSIPTNSATQRAGGTPIPRQNALPGDIIGYPGHVAVYLGRIGGVDYLLEAPDVGLRIRVNR